VSISFYTEVLPDARIASERTGVPVSVVLAQWGVETGYGTSAAWLEGSNFAGVSAGGRPVRYRDRAEGLAAYIKTMLSPRYESVRAAGSADESAKALAASAWDAGHYGDGATLLSVLERDHLTRFDNASQTETVTRAGFEVPGWVPGVGGRGFLWPWEIPGALGDAARDAALGGVRDLALWSVFVAGGAALVVAGVYRVTSPARQAATRTAARAGEAYATGGASEAARAAT
jgi:hypothetical protein